MVGLALLSIERSAYTNAVERGILQPEEWSPISKSDTTLARDVGFAGIGVFLSHDDGWAISEMDSLTTRRFDRCASLFEAGNVLLRHHSFPSRWPFEVDLFPMLSGFEKAWVDSGCALKTLDLFWDDPSLYTDFMQEKEKTFMTFPYLRTFVISKNISKWSFVPNVDQPSPF